MKVILASLCITLCLASAAAHVASGGDDVNANANAQTAVTTNASGTNANNSNVNNAAEGRDVRPGDTVHIEVSTKGAPSGGGVSQRWKDFFDIAAKLLTFVSVIVAALVAREQFKKNREESRRNRVQREEELRWKKAELARVTLGELFKDPYAENALLMLDWNGREFPIAAYEGDSAARREKISWDEMWAALRIIERKFNDKERFIRDCFDALFGHMRSLEHYLTIGLIDIEDVIYPFDYYLRHFDRNRAAYDRFTESYHPRAKQFLERVEARVQEKEAASDTEAAKEVEAAKEAEAVKEAEAAQKIDAAKESEAAKETEAAPPEPAYFLFDCWPRQERYVFMLEDEDEINLARAILDDREYYNISGRLVERPAYYNAPWAFHVEPSSVSFVEESPEFVGAVNALADRQKGNKEAGGEGESSARLLAELPARWFAPERESWEREEEARRAGQETAAAGGDAATTDVSGRDE